MVPSGPQPDVVLTLEDRDELLDALGHAFSSYQSIDNILDSVGFPRAYRPAFIDSAEQTWIEIFRQLEAGVVEQPFRRLITAARRRYQAHPVFTRLYSAMIQGQPIEHSSNKCGVIVRASGDDERARVTEILIRLGLAPVQRWATEHAVSFEVDVVEPAAVERVLDGSELGFTVVPPGAPDYLLRELYVQGPDGSRFRLVDAPAMQALGNVATEIVDQYSLGGDVDPPTVIDVVGPGGDVIRASSGETLHEAGVRDGDSIRVGFEGRAGAVHPEIRIHALQQARRQVTEFAEATPGMRVHVRAGAEPPIEYDLEFERPSFGPPGRDTGEPTLISRHIVRLLLGSDFPEVPPTAFWLTPFFHPNVFPTYDCPETARTPGARGLVCLGAPADEWNPGTRLHEICQTIVDIAGYRNYDVAERIDAGGMPRGNFFDEDAAAWAAVHGDEIARRGGRPPVAPTARRPFVRVTGAIERIDG